MKMKCLRMANRPVLALLMRLLWAAALMLPAFGAQAGVVLTTLHSFQAYQNGADPQATLVQGNDGNFYGTTIYGGTNGNVAGYGTVFKVSTNGELASLYSFTGGTDGYDPNGLVQGSDGNFYGTSYHGGTNNGGTVFKVSTNGALTTLHSFTGITDGANPAAGLVLGSDGCLYGTTAYGGTNGSHGTVFKFNTNGALTSLYSFTGGNDGAGPLAGLVLGSDGYFYGTTGIGGTNGQGTVFKISPDGALTSLYSFTGGNDGAYARAGLVQSSDGNFYGTTEYGGTNNTGTIFQISTNGALTSLYSFGGHPYDARQPVAGLVEGSDGNFYGTTIYGGTNSFGTVFQIRTNGVFAILYSFGAGYDGSAPYAGLVQGTDGSFYGTASAGGLWTHDLASTFGGNGIVFKITTNGVLTHLCFFPDIEGRVPESGLVQGSDGSFYGTTTTGGSYESGTVFKISTNGALTTLHSFTWWPDGSNPTAGLVQGSDGNFYGTTYYGGTNGDSGTVFKINTNGALTSLYSFKGAQTLHDGYWPYAGLVQGTDGNFYGTTYEGGIYAAEDYGTVFQISATGVYTILHSFISFQEGIHPYAGLVQGSDGNFYGVTDGSVFKISTSGELTNFYSFTGGNDGADPRAGLVQGSDGGLYGTTYAGGTNNFGTVFKISASGAFTSLYSFTGGNDGGNPCATLLQASDGNFYGTTYAGGTNNSGTVFKITSRGALTSLYSFTGGNDGWGPVAGLVQGSDGSFYGTTEGGGPRGVGTVFRLTTTLFSSNLVQNGGYETGDFTGWTLSGNTSWMIIDNGTRSGIPPHSGTHLAALGPSGSLGYISQTLPTIPGTSYLLSFWLNSPDGATPNEALVSWNGNTLADVTNLPAFGWTEFQFVVTATGTSTVLQFGFRDDPSNFGLDDISVVAAQPGIASFSLSGTNLVVNGNNGLSGLTYLVLMSTNLARPSSQWTPVATNVLNADGDFTIIATNAVDPNAPQRFYRAVLLP